MNAEIYILLPVHNRRDHTKRFVDCLRNQSLSNYHLVLIDDGSSDGTKEMVQRLVPDATVISGTGNWWWAGALQQGYDWIRNNGIPTSSLLLIMNNDTRFEEDFLGNAVEVLRQHARTLLLARCYSDRTNELIDSGVHVDWARLLFLPPSDRRPANCFSTRGLFMRVSDFIEIGGFHPILLPHYGSDYEFTIRARRKGMKLATHPSVKLWLDEESTGYHELEYGGVYDALKKYFSKKSARNPLMWTVFVGLACPWIWKPSNWLRVWFRTSVDVAKQILRPAARSLNA